MIKRQGGWATVKYDDGAYIRYISFGERLESPGTDSFGVAEEKIFLYSNPDEVTELFSGHPDGWCITHWSPVPVGTHIVTPPTHKVQTTIRHIIQPDVVSVPYYP